jgi:predicted ATPase
MLIMSATALVAARGYSAPEVEPTYRRALALCRKLGEVEKEFSVLLGQSMFHFLRADIVLALELARQAAELAETSGENEFDLAAHRQLGLVSCFHGDFEFSAACFDAVVEVYDIDIHGRFAFLRGGSDFGVAALATSGYALVPMGYPDQAKLRCAEAVALAQKIDHPLSEAYAHWISGYVHRECGDLKRALQHGEAMFAIAVAKGFPQYVAWATALLGIVKLDEGTITQAVMEIQKGIAANLANDARLFLAYFKVNLADAYGHNDQAAGGLTLIAEALDHVAQTEERIHESELYRVKGKLLRTGDAPDLSEAEICLREAIKVAQSQKAKLCELRAASDLARLWHDQGKQDEPRALLTPLYEWFTEGFGTADLMNAKAMLKDLD